MEIDDLTLYWLAGLLEGEGSFVAPSRSKAGRSRILITMTDEDVISRVASIFSTKYYKSDREQHQQNGWRTQYVAKITGKKAVDLMLVLHPLMGSRRQKQIENAILNYTNDRHRALTPEKMEELRQRALNGESPFWLAKEYGISKTLAYYIKDGYTYTQLDLRGYSSSVEHLPSKQDRWVRFPLPANISINNTSQEKSQLQNIKTGQQSLYWLAGLLEGEGSFLAPVPSAPNSPIISISMTDEDVIERVASLFDVKHQRWQPKNKAHKTNFMARIRGIYAALMSERRKGQIDRAIENHVYNVNRSANRFVKLDEEKVRVIKHRLAQGELPLYIANDFDVTTRTIRDIHSGRTWSHVTIDSTSEND